MELELKKVELELMKVEDEKNKMAGDGGDNSDRSKSAEEASDKESITEAKSGITWVSTEISSNKA